MLQQAKKNIQTDEDTSKHTKHAQNMFHTLIHQNKS